MLILGGIQISKPTECQCNSSGYCFLLKRNGDPPNGRLMTEEEWCQCKSGGFVELFSESEKGQIQPSVGLGDTVAKVLNKVGVKKKSGCRCAERQEKLNEIFPYKKADD